MKISIINGRLLCAATGLAQEADIHLAAGKIVAIGSAPTGFTAEQTIDARTQWVFPAAIDLAMRCQEPGFEHKATIKSETLAAAHGGVSSCCCLPDTRPVIDTPAVVELIQERSHNASAKVYPSGALTAGLQGVALSEMAALQKAGVHMMSNARAPITDSHVLRRAFEYAATYDLVVSYEAEDSSLAPKGCVNESYMSTKLGLAGIPNSAEAIDVARALLLQQQTGVKLHLSKISCQESLQLIDAAKQQGQMVTADVAIANLYLTDVDIDGFDSNFHLRPPLRSLEDLNALLAALESGLLDAICSDHTPHETNAKLTPFAESASGLSVIEHFVPLAMGLCNKSQLNELDIIAKICWRPGEILNVSQGQLAIGAPADIVVYDPNHTHVIIPEKMSSAGHNTPFSGWPLAGAVSTTLVNGKISYAKN